MVVLDDRAAAAGAGREPRRRSSRMIDRISDLLGHEVTFVAVVVGDLVVLGMFEDRATSLREHRTGAER